MFKNLAQRFPELKIELMQANIKQEPEEFVKKSFILALFSMAILIIVSVLVLLKLEKNLLLTALNLPLFFFLFLFFVK